MDAAVRRKGAIAWMAEHPVAANLILIFILVGGYICFFRVPKDVYPDIVPDSVEIEVSYPGASPEEVEQGIVLAIEEAVRGLDGIYQMESEAHEGNAQVELETFPGADVQRLAQDVQSEIDRITTFPIEAEEPQISASSWRREVLLLVVYGDVSNVVLHELGEHIRDTLLQDPNITQVEIAGLPRLEIRIEVPQETLRKYGLTLDEIATRLRNASVELPGGGVKTQSGEILMRVKERRDYGSQFAKTPIITLADGSEVLLGDIGTIHDDFEETDQSAMYNGKPAVMLSVYRIGDQTPTQIEAATLAQLESIKPTLPPGIEANVLDNRAEQYRQRAELLLTNGAFGLVLVFVMLGLFLELRLAFWVMMGIPTSFFGSLFFLPAMDISINMMSMFAYIIALGIVVDDAIVIGENIYYHHQRGLSFQDAAIVGAQELATPVVFSILTNVVTFLPLYFVPGTMGRMFNTIPVVVCVVFLVSLFESIFILPAHLGHHRERKNTGIRAWLHAGQQWFGRTFTLGVERFFGPVLDSALRHRYLVTAFGFSILAVTIAYAYSGRMGFSLFPRADSDYAQADVSLPFGAAVEKTEAAVRRVYEAALEVAADTGHPELLEGVFMQVGRGGSHAGFVQAFLADPEIRDKIMTTTEFADNWRKKVGPLMGVDNLKFSAESGGPGGRGAALTIELSHRDVNVLEQACAELAQCLASYPLCSDIDDGFQPGKQQLDFVLTPVGKSMGFTAQSVARQVRSSFYGAQVLRQQRGRNEIRVMVRRPKAERISEQHIDDLILQAPNGAEVPLREVVESTRGRAYTEINRRNGRRVIQVTADVNPRDKTLEVLSSLSENELVDLMQSYPGLSFSFEGRQADMRESMLSLKGGFILALLGIFGLLAIPFRSYIQPLIIMVSIPFGIIGAVIGHLIMGFSLSVVSMFGIVALAGVVVNDALVLIDAANRRKSLPDISPHDAILSAAIQRFRPVLLTTATTFCGLSPMIFEKSRQAQFMIPMAISLGFGIVFATVITLFLIPALYLIVEDYHRTLDRLMNLLRTPHDRVPSPDPEEISAK